MSLQIVKMRAVAVDFSRDIVAGAMGKRLSKTGLANDGAGGVVRLPTGNRSARRESRLDKRDGRIAGIADGLKDQLLASSRFAPYDASPGYVVKDRIRPVHSSPYVDEYKIPIADRLCSLFGCHVVRVGSVCVNRNIGRVFPDQALAAHSLRQPLHHRIFSR